MGARLPAAARLAAADNQPVGWRVGDVVAIGTILVFISSRRLLGGRAIRELIRGLTVIGLVVSAIGIAQTRPAMA